MVLRFGVIGLLWWFLFLHCFGELFFLTLSLFNLLAALLFLHGMA